MAGNTQMNNNERGVFSLHGLIGYFIAVALLLSISPFCFLHIRLCTR